MGTRVTGEIRIDPPLSWPEIKADLFNVDGHYEVKIEPTHDKQDTDEGYRTVITADRLLPSWEDSRKYYQIVTHVQKFANRYARADRTFTGYLECHGEEPGDLWRVAIVDGNVAVSQAATVWPEDVAKLGALVEASDMKDIESLEKAVLAAADVLIALNKQFTRKP